MKRTYTLCALGLLFAAAGVHAASSVTSNGITWTFGGSYTVGQYCTGDWWVLDPNPSSSSSGVVISGSAHAAISGVASGEKHSVNPAWGSQGYDPDAGGYSAAQTAALPITLNSGDCIVTTTALTTADHTHLYSGAILTVVDTIQPADAFRPPYCRASRAATSASDPLQYSLSDVSAAKWALLPRKPRAAISAAVPSLSSTIAKVRGPWIDHLGKSWMGEIHPQAQQEWYGRDVSQVISEAAAQLCLDYSTTELRELATYIIQIGIDNYAMVMAGAEWHPDGGHASGRKFPIVFASVMLNDPVMKDFPRMYSGTKFRFGEDGQTYYFDDPSLAAFQGPPPNYSVSSSSGAGQVAVRGVRGWVGATNGGPGDIVLWRITNDGDVSNCTAHEHLDISAWSSDTDFQRKSEAYRIGTTSAQWIGQAMAMMLFGNDTGTRQNEMITVWDHNAYFDYCIRWMSEDYTAAAARFYQKYGVTIGGQQTSNLPFVDEMWTDFSRTFPRVFRLNYGPYVVSPKNLRTKG